MIIAHRFNGGLTAERNVPIVSLGTKSETVSTVYAMYIGTKSSMNG